MSVSILSLDWADSSFAATVAIVIGGFLPTNERKGSDFMKRNLTDGPSKTLGH